MRVLPCGERAWLCELPDLASVRRYAAALRESADPDVAEIVPAARTVLVVATPGAALTSLAERLEAVAPTANTAVCELPADELVTLEVDYSGPDLAEVSRLTGLAEADVVAAHTGQDWTVAFVGFAPGFAYLVGGDERLRVPRRDVPRTRVPAGSIGLADEFTGAYPRSSPGGWQLIGRTATSLWDLTRAPPALLRPGVRVRFVAR